MLYRNKNVHKISNRNKNKKIKFLLGIILLLIIIIIFLFVINYINYTLITNTEFKDDINLIEYTEENFNDKSAEVYKSNLLKENFDTENITPNELGEIMIIMYHGVDKTISNDNVYHRSVEGFKEDLQRIYDDNYYIISLNDYLNNEIKVPVGYTPIILTFDDGLSSSFSLEYNELNELVPKKDCAVHILNEYKEKYNRPNATATFFINTKNPPFYGYGTVEERVHYLINNGYDIGNHGYNHSLMKNMTGEQIQEQIGLVENYVKAIAPQYNMLTFSYPYGGTPGETNLQYILNGNFNETYYDYKIALLASSTNNTTNIYNLDFDPFHVPRVRGTNTSLYDLGWYFDYYKENPHLKFISDGDDNTVTIQRSYEDKLNENMIKNKNVVILD